MSTRLTIVHITAEGEGVAAALQHLSALFPAPSVELTALPALEDVRPSVRTTSVPASVKAGRVRRTTDGNVLNDPAARGEAIVKLLAHRAMRVPEIADALCRDKRDVKVMAQRLYPAMVSLKLAGKVKKVGNTYALK